MNGWQERVNVLSAQVRRGDARAAALLRKQVEPPLRNLVRHALRTGEVRTVVARRAHAEAERLRADDLHLFLDDVALVERVAESLCDTFLTELRTRARPATFADTLSGVRDESVLECGAVI